MALYETVAEDPDPAAIEAAHDADYVTFTSSSTVRNLVAAVGDRFPGRARVVSIEVLIQGPSGQAPTREDLEARSFAEFTLSGTAGMLRFAQHDSEGLRMTGRGSWHPLSIFFTPWLK